MVSSWVQKENFFHWNGKALILCLAEFAWNSGPRSHLPVLLKSAFFVFLSTKKEATLGIALTSVTFWQLLLRSWFTFMFPWAFLSLKACACWNERLKRGLLIQKTVLAWHKLWELEKFGLSSKWRKSHDCVSRFYGTVMRDKLMNNEIFIGFES